MEGFESCLLRATAVVKITTSVLVRGGFERDAQGFAVVAAMCSSKTSVIRSAVRNMMSGRPLRAQTFARPALSIVVVGDRYGLLIAVEAPRWVAYREFAGRPSTRHDAATGITRRDVAWSWAGRPPGDLRLYRSAVWKGSVRLMTCRVVILGGGTGGTLTANRLRRRFKRDEMDITVVDQDDRHVYQPGLLFVPFGLTHVEDIVRPRGTAVAPRHRVRRSSDRPRRHRGAARCTSRTDRRSDYDVLVVATGAPLVPEETEGLIGPGGWRRSSPSTHPRAPARWSAALATFDGGRLVVNVVDMPIKCPVAPLEFCFLADWYFHERGIRDQVQLTYVTPLDGAFTKPVASAAPRRDAGRTRHRARDRVQHRRGRRRRRTAGRLRRSRGPVRPRRGCPAARRRRVRRPLTRAR